MSPKNCYIKDSNISCQTELHYITMRYEKYNRHHIIGLKQM